MRGSVKQFNYEDSDADTIILAKLIDDREEVLNQYT